MAIFAIAAACLVRCMGCKVTALEVQKHSKDRVNVYLDEVFAFGLAAIEAVHLHVGDELSDEQIAELKVADMIERAYMRTLDFLSYRPRSEAELYQYLLGRCSCSEDVADIVVQRLSRAGFIDDTAFAQYWVENRTAFRPRGQRALVYELRQKGVSADIVEAALMDFDEREAAWAVAEEQARKLEHLQADKFRKRLSGRLARRGFSYDLIREILDHYASSDDQFCDVSEDE